MIILTCSCKHFQTQIDYYAHDSLRLRRFGEAGAVSPWKKVLAMKADMPRKIGLGTEMMQPGEKVKAS